MSYLLVFIGGGLGSLLRFLLSSALCWPVDAGRFPIKTFAVNMLGCLLIGFLSGLFSSISIRAEVKNLLIAGFCGGFTTFSTFSRETYDLFAAGSGMIAIAYAVLSVTLGVLFVLFGYTVASRIAG